MSHDIKHIARRRSVPGRCATVKVKSHSDNFAGDDWRMWLSKRHTAAIRWRIPRSCPVGRRRLVMPVKKATHVHVRGA